MIEEFLHENIRSRWINGYKNKYAAREDGEIISYVGSIPKIRKQKYHQKGYKHIELSTNRKNKTFRVHRIIAETFIENTDNKPQIDHIDEVKDNNHYTNLRWCTNRENLDFYYKNKFGEKWIPVIYPTDEERIQNKIEKIKLKEKIKIEKIKNMKYGSLAKMIEATSNPVVVNKIEYRSAKEAARFICEDKDIIAKVGTVRKEIQNMINGKRKPWIYKNKYKIDFSKK